MSEAAKAAVGYRERAKQLRATAETKSDEGHRRAFLGIAADYDLMAETMDAIDRSIKTLRRFPH